MIVSSVTTDLRPRGGRFTARYAFTLSDGREVLRGPVNVDSPAHAEDKRVALEPDVLAAAQQVDASEAVELGVLTAHREASDMQVKYAWLLAGFNEDEHYKAYALMRDVGPALLSLGLTDAEYAVMLNTTEEEASSARQYWEFLDANSAALIAYEAIT